MCLAKRRVNYYLTTFKTVTGCIFEPWTEVDYSLITCLKITFSLYVSSHEKAQRVRALSPVCRNQNFKTRMRIEDYDTVRERGGHKTRRSQT